MHRCFGTYHSWWCDVFCQVILRPSCDVLINVSFAFICAQCFILDCQLAGLYWVFLKAHWGCVGFIIAFHGCERRQMIFGRFLNDEGKACFWIEIWKFVGTTLKVLWKVLTITTKRPHFFVFTLTKSPVLKAKSSQVFKVMPVGCKVSSTEMYRESFFWIVTLGSIFVARTV